MQKIHKFGAKFIYCITLFMRHMGLPVQSNMPVQASSTKEEERNSNEKGETMVGGTEEVVTMIPRGKNSVTVSQTSASIKKKGAGPLPLSGSVKKEYIDSIPKEEDREEIETMWTIRYPFRQILSSAPAPSSLSSASSASRDGIYGNGSTCIQEAQVETTANAWRGRGGEEGDGTEWVSKTCTSLHDMASTIPVSTHKNSVQSKIPTVSKSRTVSEADNLTATWPVPVKKEELMNEEEGEDEVVTVQIDKFGPVKIAVVSSSSPGSASSPPQHSTTAPLSATHDFSAPANCVVPVTRAPPFKRKRSHNAMPCLGTT